MTIADPERVSYEEATERGLHELLLGAVSKHPVAVETPEGDVVVMRSEDLYDLLFALGRLADDSGKRYSLDEIITEFGFTRDEIAATD